MPVGVAQAEHTDRLIVKLRATADSNSAGMAERAAAAAGITIRGRHTLSTDTEVLHLHSELPVEDVAALAARLAADPAVAYAEPDRRRYPQLVPNDPSYLQQWYWYEDTGGVRMPGAWDVSTGSNSVVVAMIDSGIRPHSEFSARIVPGYDFISDVPTANDGDGRDNDPSDPGDWVDNASRQPGCPVEDSSWHGTAIAGLIGATGNNNAGIAGAAWQTRLLPVRALGRCGGFISDIAAGVRWAAGLQVSGVPANTHPARIINLSLGGGGTCSRTEQDAIDAATGAGALVVVAAGNEAGNVSANSPANCQGVLVVAGTTRAGARGSYTNIGSAVAISAPGGSSSEALLSTSNTGTQGPVADGYAQLYGTSVATATVSGVAALVWATKPALTAAQVRAQLRATARAFPDGSCTTSTCGAGIVDAAAAVASVTGAVAPVADAGSDQQVNTGTSVNLRGSGSDDGSITQHAWTQQSGSAVTLTNANQATASFTAPDSAATLVFRLTVTDNQNLSHSDTVTVTVNAAGGGGGGGSTGWWVLLLTAAGIWARRRRPLAK